MARRLPPLNALRAFEAAARLLSFAKAAEELNVTPAAVSHQVKALEDALGVKLFRRANRAIWLTEAGQSLLPDLRDGFDRLAAGVERLRRKQAHGALTVSAPPSFAAKWLLHRLDHFRVEHPDIDIRLDASTKLCDFERDEVDIAVRYGKGDYPGLDVRLMLCEEVFPVCSPALLENGKPLKSPEDLKHFTLLHEDAYAGIAGTYPDWRMWLHAAGVRDLDSDRGPRYSETVLCVQAAVNGQGVALGRSVVVEDDLRAGRLVKPLPFVSPTTFAYYLVAPRGWEERPKVATFGRWILDEAAKAQREKDAQEQAAAKEASKAAAG